MPVAFWLVTCFNITIDAIYPNRLRGKSKSKMLCLESTNYPEAGLDECLKFCEWPYNNWIVNLLPCALSNMLQSKTDTPCQWIQITCIFLFSFTLMIAKPLFQFMTLECNNLIVLNVTFMNYYYYYYFSISIICSIIGVPSEFIYCTM